MNAKDRPVQKSKIVDSRDIDIDGAEQIIDIETAQHMPAIEVAESMTPRSLDVEAFMAETLTVEILQAQSKSDSPLIYLGHPTRPEWARWLPRGVPLKLKRFEVDILCNAKSGTVGQEKKVDEEGADYYVDKSMTHLSYPFQVQEDPSGSRGSAWLKGRLQSTA